MKPICNTRLFAAVWTVVCLLAATVGADAAVRGKAILTGVVYGDGAPLAGVHVSDGVQFATTDAAGRYRLESDKSAGFVFAVTPSNWVAAEADGIQPLFWAALDATSDRDERHDFRFASVDQSRYTMLFFTDLHLTNSSEKHDLDHYRSIAVPSIADEAAQASARGPVYSLNLGDLSHDLYWYQYDFNVASAKRFLEQNGFPTLLYSIPGNHDHDAATQAGEAVDRRAEHLFRSTFGPTYYAMNIGDVHWIMMDNIIYKNTPGKGKKNVGVVGARDYDRGFTPTQLAWLRRDLATVDASKTVCLCTHCPIFFRDARRTTLLSDAAQVDSLDAYFSRFDKVHLFSGHAHRTFYLKSPDYPRFEQYILPATSGEMWTTNDRFQALCPDGSDAGFVVATVDGGRFSYAYRTEAYGRKVLRAYDMNSVGEYYRRCELVGVQQRLYPERADYGRPEYANCVYVNYWGYKPGQRVEMYEQGRALDVKQVEDEDPLCNISHYLPSLAKKPVFKESDAQVISHHMFAAKARTATAPVEIRIMDADGVLLHCETLERPKKFDKEIR